MADYLNIAGRVRTTASDGVAMEAQEVKDLNLDKSQQEINADVQTELGDRYTKEETYSKEQLDDLITTPDVNHVSVVATDATTAVTDVLPATGESNTIYRVGNWNGTQYDPTMYALYAWNSSAYVCLAVRSFVGEVYDISVNHPDGQGNPTPYDDLTAALGTGGANIPADIRRGGMSIKFIQENVQSSDNKYVQYRFLLSGSFAASQFTNTANWQSENVDTEPTAGSKNLAESGGIWNKYSWELEGKFVSPFYSDSNNSIFTKIIPANTRFYVKLNITGTVTRIVLYYNGNTDKRIVDSNNSSVEDVTGKWISYRKTDLDITSLGVFLQGTGCTVQLEVKYDEGEITKLQNSVSGITSSVNNLSKMLYGNIFVSNYVTSSNFQIFSGNIPAKTVFRVKLNARGDLTRVIINYNNDAEKRLIDSNNSSVTEVVGKWLDFSRNVDITALGLYFTGGTGAEIQMEVIVLDSNAGDIGDIKNNISEINAKDAEQDNQIKDLVEQTQVYEISATTTESNTRLLNNLNLKNSKFRYYVKVEVESYTRIIINRNGNTDLRLFDTNTNTSFINNYVQAYIDSSTTALGLYLSGVSSAKLYLKSVPFEKDCLAGKKWYACGDSFTAGGWSYKTSANSFRDNPYKGEYRVYPFYIGRRIDMDIHNIAVGGMSMCANRNDDTDNSFTASGTPNHPTPLYQSIPEDVDIVTLYFGINDNNYGCPLGSMDDGAGNQSFYGAWNEVLTWLTTNRPNAKIGIVITNGSAPRFTAAERELAKKYGIPYLDLELDVERVPYLIRQRERTVSGGGDMDDSIALMRNNQHAVDWGTNNHPNEKCHELESTIIENWLRTL